MIDLSGNIALVTGGSRGIGKAIALRLAEAGADIVLNFVSSRTAADETAEAIAALGRRVAVVQADVSEPEDVAAMIDFVGESFGRLDIVISNAAAGEQRPILETTPDQFTLAMNTNVGGLITLVQAARPWLAKSPARGKVIGISNHASEYALPNLGLVGASKAAMESALRHLARELGPAGINCNIVQAGLVAGHGSTLVGDRTLAAADVANAVLFLASPLSDLIQGQTLVVDAGAAIAA